MPRVRSPTSTSHPAKHSTIWERQGIPHEFRVLVDRVVTSEFDLEARGGYVTRNVVANTRKSTKLYKPPVLPGRRSSFSVPPRFSTQVARHALYSLVCPTDLCRYSSR